MKNMILLLVENCWCFTMYNLKKYPDLKVLLLEK